MNADWTGQLAPERAPPPPPWWPPAMGWWFVAALIVMLFLASIAWSKYWRGTRRRVQAAALAELARIRLLSDASQPRAIQRLMRRYALTVYGAGAVASLSGEAWLRFVEAHGGEAFAGTNGPRFLAAAYGNGAGQPEWLRAAEAFIKRPRPRRSWLIRPRLRRLRPRRPRRSAEGS